ncbi:FKBP-type peptidyl-prolyl cis-trans isomerase [Nocardioides campestrisoli]|uniref:FKBP-type peptidyl-prolyl cis-trans isomerase n=1 Tax=Nocardioides campestrisoli TaxID=2736757 RepID=UPI0015E6BF67|nr:FKBP-type peptidyl-prolyl cis-trans isomerase [Nocardioides campestrisoli]
MSRRTAAAAALAVGLLSLTACGDDSGDEGSGNALDAVTIEATPGKAPEVTWDEKMDPSEIETDVLVEGDGEPAEAGDSVLVHVWIGNGFEQEQSFSSYDQKQPTLITIDDTLLPGLKAGLEGQKIGSVVAVAASAEDAYGEAGNSSLGIGNKDSVLFVTELLDGVANEPTGEERTPAKWAPKLLEEDGKVTGFDFAGTPKPNGKLWVTKTVKGDGPAVKKGQTIYVNYLGQVYEGKEPFDESYSKGQPAQFPIGVGQVVKGWDQSLVGETVGSRIIVAVPPQLGYGEKGNEQAGIKGTDTLYFVVDILAAV